MMMRKVQVISVVVMAGLIPNFVLADLSGGNLRPSQKQKASIADIDSILKKSVAEDKAGTKQSDKSDKKKPETEASLRAEIDKMIEEIISKGMSPEESLKLKENVQLAKDIDSLRKVRNGLIPKLLEDKAKTSQEQNEKVLDTLASGPASLNAIAPSQPLDTDDVDEACFKGVSLGTFNQVSSDLDKAFGYGKKEFGHLAERKSKESKEKELAALIERIKAGKQERAKLAADKAQKKITDLIAKDDAGKTSEERIADLDKKGSLLSSTLQNEQNELDDYLVNIVIPQLSEDSDNKRDLKKVAAYTKQMFQSKLQESYDKIQPQVKKLTKNCKDKADFLAGKGKIVGQNDPVTVVTQWEALVTGPEYAFQTFKPTLEKEIGKPQCPNLSGQVKSLYDNLKNQASQLENVEDDDAFLEAFQSLTNNAAKLEGNVNGALNPVIKKCDKYATIIGNMEKRVQLKQQELASANPAARKGGMRSQPVGGAPQQQQPQGFDNSGSIH